MCERAAILTGRPLVSGERSTLRNVGSALQCDVMLMAKCSHQQGQSHGPQALPPECF